MTTGNGNRKAHLRSHPYEDFYCDISLILFGIDAVNNVDKSMFLLVATEKYLI